MRHTFALYANKFCSQLVTVINTYIWITVNGQRACTRYSIKLYVYRSNWLKTEFIRLQIEWVPPSDLFFAAFAFFLGSEFYPKSKLIIPTEKKMPKIVLTFVNIWIGLSEFDEKPMKHLKNQNLRFPSLTNSTVVPKLKFNSIVLCNAVKISNCPISIVWFNFPFHV